MAWCGPLWVEVLKVAVRSPGARSLSQGAVAFLGFSFEGFVYTVRFLR
jgi:hypothetical protein